MIALIGDGHSATIRCPTRAASKPSLLNRWPINAPLTGCSRTLPSGRTVSAGTGRIVSETKECSCKLASSRTSEYPRQSAGSVGSPRTAASIAPASADGRIGKRRAIGVAISPATQTERNLHRKIDLREINHSQTNESEATTTARVRGLVGDRRPRRDIGSLPETGRGPSESVARPGNRYPIEARIGMIVPLNRRPVVIRCREIGGSIQMTEHRSRWLTNRWTLFVGFAGCSGRHRPMRWR